MMRTIKWYYDTKGGKLYDANGYPEGATIPEVFAGELAGVAVQLCVGEPTFDSTTGAITNADTSFAGTLATGEFVVDNDYNHYAPAALAEALTSGTAVSTITISGIATVRPLGSVKLDAAHTVYFCAATRDADGNWVLTTADSTYTAAQYTPEASYAELTAVSVIDMPIIVGSNPDSSQRATGLFTAQLDANNPVFLELVEDNAEIGGTMIEFSVYISGRPELKCRTLLDCLGALTLPPSQTYNAPYIWAALDSRYITLTQWALADQYQFSVSGGTAASWHSAQTSADRYYRIRRGDASAWGAEIALVVGAAGTSSSATVVKSGTVATITCTTGSVSTTATVSDGSNGAIVTNAGIITVTLDGGTSATLVNSISGGTTTVAVSGGTLVVPTAFLATSGECEYDLITSQGENISLVADLRGWLTGADGYVVAYEGLSASGATYTYYLKPCGIKGADGTSTVAAGNGLTASTASGTTTVAVNYDAVQGKLTAGANVTLDGNTISAAGGTVVGGNGLTTTTESGTTTVELDSNYLEVANGKLKFNNCYVGVNYTFTVGEDAILLVDHYGTLRFTNGTTSENFQFGDIQHKLTAGANVTLDGNTISATNTTYTAGSGVTITGGTTIAAPKYGATDTTSIASGTVAIAAWTRYTGTCDALTIASIEDSDLESMLLVTFAGTASAPDIGFPVGTHYPAEMTFPAYEAGKTYLISVQNNWVIVSEQATVEAE